jgi:hypothetical protein
MSLFWEVLAWVLILIPVIATFAVFVFVKGEKYRKAQEIAEAIKRQEWPYND